MKMMLIPPSAIRRMDITTLREKATELQANSVSHPDRQALYNTYVRITDEIAKRNAKVAEHPLLIKRSSVYRMTVGELRAQVAEMSADAKASEPAWANTIALMQGELERRKRHDKVWYDKRKAERGAV